MSKKSLLLNRTLLISLVRERPAIWDKTIKNYKCKRAKTEAWRDICLALNKDYDKLDHSQRKEYFQQLIRMWTHIRDSWMKSMKDKRNKKELTKPYIYHEQLLFLKKIFRQREAYENRNNEPEQQKETAVEEKEKENPGKSGFSKEIQQMMEDDNQIEMSKKSIMINRIQLINLVKERPTIWDKTSDIYKNKTAKADAWRDICLIMNEHYEQMNLSRRKEYFKLLISIWTQIRDTWMRSVKNKNCRPYKHHEKLLFLKKIINSTDVRENLDSSGDNEQENTIDDESESVGNSCSSMKRQRQDDDGREYNHYKDLQKKNSPCQTDTEDRNYSFFKSIQPILAYFNDDQILQFQAGTINLLQKIKSEQNANESQQDRISSIRNNRLSEDEPLVLNQDPIKIETYEIY